MGFDNRGQGDDGDESKIEKKPKRPYENWGLMGGVKKKVTGIIDEQANVALDNPGDAFSNAYIPQTHSLAVQEMFLKQLHNGLETMCHQMTMIELTLARQVNAGVSATTVEVKRRFGPNFYEITGQTKKLKDKIIRVDMGETVRMISDLQRRPE